MLSELGLLSVGRLELVMLLVLEMGLWIVPFRRDHVPDLPLKARKVLERLASLKLLLMQGWLLLLLKVSIAGLVGSVLEVREDLARLEVGERVRALLLNWEPARLRVVRLDVQLERWVEGVV